MLSSVDIARARRVSGDKTWRSLAESVRVELSDWSCLPKETHQRLHQELPPIDRRE